LIRIGATRHVLSQSDKKSLSQTKIKFESFCRFDPRLFLCPPLRSSFRRPPSDRASFAVGFTRCYALARTKPVSVCAAVLFTSSAPPRNVCVRLTYELRCIYTGGWYCLCRECMRRFSLSLFSLFLSLNLCLRFISLSYNMCVCVCCICLSVSVLSRIREKSGYLSGDGVGQPMRWRSVDCAFVCSITFWLSHSAGRWIVPCSVVLYTAGRSACVDRPAVLNAHTIDIAGAWSLRDVSASFSVCWRSVLTCLMQRSHAFRLLTITGVYSVRYPEAVSSRFVVSEFVWSYL